MALPISRIPAGLGQRVVRGPDWKWDNQDGGDGHVGTLITVEQCPSSGGASSFCVRVLWDGGTVNIYRASWNGACDLRLYDSGPVGIRFTTVTCDVCSKSGISGTRWKCSVCFDYDLCHSCYMSDRHRLDHAFIRIDKPGAQEVKVPPRQGSTKVRVHGIFEGAEVERGLHWKWADQDGGQGSVGTVLSIRDWNDSSVRSAARVQWSSSSVSSYRLGFGGDVDLKCIKCTEPALGGGFYKNHMPLIAPVDVSRSEVGKSGFRVGDTVCVTLDVDCFKMLQEGHGGWLPSLAEIMNKVGGIQKESSTGDVFVSFGSIARWIINPVALTKCVGKVGSTVSMGSDGDPTTQFRNGEERCFKHGRAEHVDKPGASGSTCTGGNAYAMKELQTKLREMESTLQCGICMERQRNIVFTCGHGACDSCSRELQDCHICRRTITSRITVY